MKRKVVSLLMAAVMLTSLCLGGCGNKDAQPSGNESKESSTASEPVSSESKEESKASELEEATIQIWIGGPGKQKDSDKVWEAFNEMLKDYVPNTTVEFSVIPTGEYKEKYTQMLATGEGVDAVWVANWVTGNIDQDIRDGNLMALDTLLDEYGQGVKDALGDAVLDMHRFSDGNLYYMVSWQGLLAGQRGIFVPTELAKLAGDTWVEDTQAIVSKWWNNEFTVENYQAVFDQFDKYLGACKDAGKLYGGLDAYTFLGWLYDQNLQDGVNMREVGPYRLDNSFKVVDSVEGDAMRTFAKNMADFYKKGYIRSDIASIDYSDKSVLYFVKDGKYDDNTLITFMDNNYTKSTVDQKSAGAGVDVSVIGIEDSGYLGKGDATAMAIPYCADDPERAMMVLSAIYSVPELYQLLIYGIPGEHYTDNGDGTITTSYGSTGTADADYGLWKWTIGTCVNSLVTQADVAGYYDELAEAEKKAYVSPFINFSFDPTGVADVSSALQAIDNEYSQIIRKGYMGDKWEETLNKWISERKAAGVDTFIAEYQKQLDEYIKENNITSW